MSRGAAKEGEMTQLEGTWTVYKITAKGGPDEGVIQEDSELTLLSGFPTGTITYVPHMGLGVPIDLTTHGEDDFALTGGEVEIRGKVNSAISGKNVLTGYAKTSDGSIVDSFLAVRELVEVNPPCIEGGLYQTSVLTHSGQGVLGEGTRLWVPEARTLALVDKSGNLHGMGQSSDLLTAADLDDSNFTMGLRALKFKGGFPEAFLLLGHVTLVSPFSGPDDADSFTAVRVGPGNPGGEGGRDGS
jgi:hypothetical protein